MNGDDVQVWLSIDMPSPDAVVAVRDKAADRPEPDNVVIDQCNDYLLNGGWCVICGAGATGRGSCDEHRNDVIL